MRKLLRLLTALALLGGFLATGAVPAGAQTVGAGAGEVIGEVTITSPASGLPLHDASNNVADDGSIDQWCDGGATSYSFGSTVLTGAITGNGPSGPVTYAGPINATASGGVTGCEDSSGTYADSTSPIPSLTGTVSGSVAGVVTVDGVTCSISGTITGSFTRVGPLVIVKLLVTYDIKCDTPVGLITASGKADVKVAAVFVPTDGDGVNDPVRAAAFSGAWQAVDATA